MDLWVGLLVGLWVCGSVVQSVVRPSVRPSVRLLFLSTVRPFIHSFTDLFIPLFPCTYVPSFFLAFNYSLGSFVLRESESVSEGVRIRK